MLKGLREGGDRGRKEPSERNLARHKLRKMRKRPDRMKPRLTGTGRPRRAPPGGGSAGQRRIGSHPKGHPLPPPSERPSLLRALPASAAAHPHQAPDRPQPASCRDRPGRVWPPGPAAAPRPREGYPPSGGAARHTVKLKTEPPRGLGPIPDPALRRPQGEDQAGKEATRRPDSGPSHTRPGRSPPGSAGERAARRRGAGAAL